MPSIEQLTDYHDRLERHDWHFHNASDWRRYDAGRLADQLLASESFTSPEHEAMYVAFSRYFYTGPAFGTERAPMPIRPMGQTTLF